MTAPRAIYEHRTHSLLAWSHFLRRAARHLIWALLILGAPRVSAPSATTVAGTLVAPWLHRLFHLIHLEKP